MSNMKLDDETMRMMSDKIFLSSDDLTQEQFDEFAKGILVLAVDHAKASSTHPTNFFLAGMSVMMAKAMSIHTPDVSVKMVFKVLTEVFEHEGQGIKCETICVPDSKEVH
jgi:hypothetical protein